MAGIAESCTHVAAVLFYIEAAVQIQKKKTVTDVPAYWMLPASVDKVKPYVDHKIDFSSGAAKKAALDTCISGGRRTSRIQTRVSSAGHKRTVADLALLLEVHSKSRENKSYQHA